MTKLTLNARVTNLENQVANIDSKLDRLIALMEQPAVVPEPPKPAKKGTHKPAGTKKRAKAKADKPATYGEAIAAWEKAKGITPESKAAYKAYYAVEYAARWDKWANSKERAGLKGDAVGRRNREKSAQIREAIKRDWEAMNA